MGDSNAGNVVLDRGAELCLEGFNQVILVDEKSLCQAIKGDRFSIMLINPFLDLKN